MKVVRLWKCTICGEIKDSRFDRKTTVRYKSPEGTDTGQTLTLCQSCAKKQWLKEMNELNTRMSPSAERWLKSEGMSKYDLHDLLKNYADKVDYAHEVGQRTGNTND